MMFADELTRETIPNPQPRVNRFQRASLYLFTPHRVRTTAILAVLVVFVIIGALLSPHFLTASNLLNVARQMSIVGIASMGMTFVILTAGIDLSIGSILGFSAITAAWLLTSGVPWPIAVLLTIVTGTLVGMINGLGITRGGVQPFIMTLSMLVIARGVTMTLSKGQPLPLGDTAGSVAWIGSGNFAGLPVPLWILLATFLISSFVLRNTPFGWHVYAVGGNLEGARRSGLNTRRTITSVYMISGACAAISALIIITRLTAGEPSQGTLLELDAIAAVVIGGTSLFGGVGGVGATLVGAGILAVTGNLLNLLGVSPFSQQIVKGLIILGAVLLERRVPMVAGPRHRVDKPGNPNGTADNGLRKGRRTG